MKRKELKNIIYIVQKYGHKRCYKLLVFLLPLSNILKINFTKLNLFINYNLKFYTKFKFKNIKKWKKKNLFKSFNKNFIYVLEYFSIDELYKWIYLVDLNSINTNNKYKKIYKLIKLFQKKYSNKILLKLLKKIYKYYK